VDLVTNREILLRSRKTTENLNGVARSQDLADAYRVMASTPAFKHTNLSEMKTDNLHYTLRFSLYHTK